MKFETITASDLVNIRQLQPPDWPDIIPFIEYYLGHPFCRSVKHVINGQIAGIGTGIVLGKTAWLAHIIVGPEFRNKGIGGSVVEHLLGGLKDTGCETVSLIATELGYPVYRKAGFTEQAEYAGFERADIPPDIPAPVSVRETCKNDQEKIFQLDRTAYGEDRSVLLKEFIGQSSVCERNGLVDGYFFPKPWEGLIAAETPESGLELMENRIRNFHKAMLPTENKAGMQFLKDNGFHETKRVKRMVYGKEFPWKPEMIFNRISGNLG